MRVKYRSIMWRATRDHHTARRFRQRAGVDAITGKGNDRNSCVSIFSSKIRCGDCGRWYTSKVWNSNDKYRKVIWQCNHKFDGGEKCTTPHLDEEIIRQLFINALNAINDEKTRILAGFEEIRDTAF